MQTGMPNMQPANTPVNTRSYADVTRNNTMDDNSHSMPIDDNQITVTKFLEEFKQMFNQLMQHYSIVLNMLTTMINKIK